MTIDDLVNFARAHHEGFKGMPDATMRALFETYKKTTIIWHDAGQIKGLAIYQEWPDLLNFFCIVGTGSASENLKMMLRGKKDLPAKSICFFDERSMELKTICRH